MKRVMVILSLLFVTSASNGQHLSVGDQVPSGLPLGKKALGAYSGKIVIIDFMATWDFAVVSTLSVLDYLQNKYSNKLHIILVSSQEKTGDTEKKLKNFYKKYISGEGRSLEVVGDDSILSSYFDYHIVPHYVWIGLDGKVIAITGPEQITEHNIETALAGKRLDLPIKIDALEPVDFK
jgi:thiol-disulfide isomerase/thioredoxin